MSLRHGEKGDMRSIEKGSNIRPLTGGVFIPRALTRFGTGAPPHTLECQAAPKVGNSGGVGGPKPRVVAIPAKRKGPKVRPFARGLRPLNKEAVGGGADSIVGPRAQRQNGLPLLKKIVEGPTISQLARCGPRFGDRAFERDGQIVDDVVHGAKWIR